MKPKPPLIAVKGGLFSYEKEIRYTMKRKINIIFFKKIPNPNPFLVT